MALSAGQGILDCIDRFEVSSASQPVGRHKDLHVELRWFLQIAHHEVLAAYGAGTAVERVLADWRGRPDKLLPGPRAHTAIPMDTITHLCLGSDLAPIPADVVED